MSPPTHAKPPSPHQLRAELEAMVLGDLLGPAGGEGEELTERAVRDRYLVGVLAPSRAGARAAGLLAKDGLPCSPSRAVACSDRIMRTTIRGDLR